ALAASPPGPPRRSSFTAPVLGSMRPMLTAALGVFEVNHKTPSRSAQASWIRVASFEGVPSDQSLPSVWGTGVGTLCGSRITSYCLNTTRAASPDGRAGSVILVVLFGP